MPVEKLSEDIYLIDTLALGFREFMASYLVMGGEKNALIDLGYASSFPVLVESLGEIGLKPDDVDYLIITHLHLDHSGAASLYVKSSENSVVYCHPKAVRHLVNPSRLIESAGEVYGEYVKLFGDIGPVPREKIIEAEDGERIRLGDLTLRVIYAPGHAPHQIVVYVEEAEALITGDAVSVQQPSSPFKIPATPPPSYNHQEAIETLRKLSRLRPRRILRPHFGEVRDTGNFFEDEVKVLETWRRIVGEAMMSERDHEEAVRKAINNYVEAMKIDLSRSPLLTPLVLRISFQGMKKYLEEHQG